MAKIRVALFPGQGLDQFRSYLVEEDKLPDTLAELFGAKRLDSELISPVHALYKPVGESTHADWFVMIRDDGETGRLVDLPESDARDLPRMLAERDRLLPLSGTSTPNPDESEEMDSRF